MALRNFNFDVSINGIMPNIVNDAGIQGDHGVTRLNFMLTEDIYQEIIGSVTDGKVMYRFDLYDGEGGVWQSDALALVGRDVGITLQERHTRFGGKLIIYLVLTALTSEDKTEVELYNLPVMLQLKNRPSGVYQQGEDYESVISLVENAKRQVDMASDFAEESKNYNNQAREFAEEVETKLRNGEFDGIGIEEAKIVNDELIITYSNKITKNLGNIKGQKGEKGDKGDKGDTPDLTNYYTKDEIGGMFSNVDGRFSEVDTHIDAVETTLINNYYTKTAIDTFDYANKKYVDNAISNIDIPTDTKDLTNGAGYVTQTDVNTAIKGIEIPTKVSALENDSDYADKKYVDEAVANVNTGGSVDLGDYYTKAEVDEVTNNKVDKILVPIDDIFNTNQTLDDGTYTGILTNLKNSAPFWEFTLNTGETNILIRTVDLAGEYSIEYFVNIGYVVGGTYQVVIENQYVESVSRWLTLADYYTKTEVDAKIANGGSVDLSNYYTKDEIAELKHVTTNDLDNTLSNYSTKNDVNTATDNLKYIATYSEVENGRIVVFDTSAEPLKSSKTRVEFNDFWGISVTTNTYTDDEGNEEKLPIYVGTSRIEGVGAPVNDTDASTKGYVDGLVGDIESLLGGI